MSKPTTNPRVAACRRRRPARRGAARHASALAAAARPPPVERAPGRQTPLTSPGSMARRSSSQPCRIATAAAWSMTLRWPLARTPAWRSDRCALTVVSRSSASRTGIGAIRRGQLVGQLDRVTRRRAGAVGQGSRQTDDHLDRVLLGDQRDQPSQMLAGPLAADRLHRGGQDAVRVAAWPRRCAHCPRRCRAAAPVRDRRRRADPAGDARSPLSRPALSLPAPRRAPRRCPTHFSRSPAPGPPSRRHDRRQPRRAA